ncbi:MAG: Rab family GTPase [Candidatus Thermoplasmatota archaeon]
MQEIKKKICLLGDPAVGKTSLIRRFVYDIFENKYASTIGTKVTKKSISIDEKKVTLLIWDIMGQKYQDELSMHYYRGAEGALVVCDVTLASTLRSIDSWVKAINAVIPRLPIVFLGNKCDLRMDKFFEIELLSLAGKYGCKYYLTSAKTGENVQEAFLSLAKELL